MSTRGRLLLVFLVIAIHQVRYNVARPFVPLYMEAAGAGPLTLGVVVSAVALVPMVLAVPTGSFGDRHGVRPMLALGTVAATVALVFLALSSNLVVVIASQILTGLSHMVVILALQPYLSKLATGRRREKHMAWYSVAASAGLVGGPILGGLLLVPFDYPTMFLLMALLGLLPLAATPFFQQRNAGVARASRPIRSGSALRSLRSPAIRIGVIISACASLMDSLRVSFLPIYLGREAAFSAAEVGLALAVFSAAALAARVFLPWVLDRVGRWWTVALVMGIGAVSAATVPFLGAAVTLVLIAGMGLSFGVGKPLSLVFVSEGSSERERGLAMGLRVSANRAADFGAPLAFGGLVGLFGLAASFASAGLVVGAAGIYLLGPGLRTRFR